MKKTILDRYAVTEDGRIVIDVSVRSVEQLYHDFDRTSPYHKKELDQEFIDYLTDCVREIRKSDFVIQISLENEPNDTVKERVDKSIDNYYLYLKELEMRALQTMFKRFLILLGIGIVFLVLAVLTTRRLTVNQGVVSEVFASGLTIAAWVSLWEAIVLLFMEWQPHRHNIRLFNKIVDAPVRFRVISSSEQDDRTNGQ
jgi:hypothetical protein